MKKSLIVFALLFGAFQSKSQQTEENRHVQPVDYLEKCRKQRNTGFIMLGGGAAMFTAGAIAMQNSQSKGQNEIPLLIGGLAAASASVPFFIAAGINKHKANIYLKRDALKLTPGQSSIIYNSVALRLNL